MNNEKLSVIEMVRGLVRAAELYEQNQDRGDVGREGKLWDDEARAALESARARGWGRNAIGTLDEARADSDGEQSTPGDLRKELGELLNRHSLENGSNTPDFVLADLLASALEVFDRAIVERDRWYGGARSPGGCADPEELLPIRRRSPVGGA